MATSRKILTFTSVSKTNESLKLWKWMFVQEHHKHVYMWAADYDVIEVISYKHGDYAKVYRFNTQI